MHSDISFQRAGIIQILLMSGKNRERDNCPSRDAKDHSIYRNPRLALLSDRNIGSCY